MTRMRAFYLNGHRRQGFNWKYVGISNLKKIKSQASVLTLIPGRYSTMSNDLPDKHMLPGQPTRHARGMAADAGR